MDIKTQVVQSASAPPSQAPGLPPSAEPSAIRRFLLSRGSSSGPDRAFRVLMLVCALSIFAIVALIATELVLRSQLTLHKFGMSFFYKSAWDPAHFHLSMARWFRPSWRC